MTASQKQLIRRRAHAARAAQPEQDAVSRRILRRATKLPEYRAARTVLFYLDIRDEVRTRFMVQHVLKARTKVAVIPWCAGRRLNLFRVTDWAQLEPGCFDVLEPKVGLRGEARHGIGPGEIDVALVPGVAFGPKGARIGHGHGFYDRLLAELPLSTPLIGLAYDCQVFPPFAVEPHDVTMDRVVTESRVYVGSGRLDRLRR